MWLYLKTLLVYFVPVGNRMPRFDAFLLEYACGSILFRCRLSEELDVLFSNAVATWAIGFHGIHMGLSDFERLATLPNRN